jgi:hypothetical protein
MSVERCAPRIFQQKSVAFKLLLTYQRELTNRVIKSLFAVAQNSELCSSSSVSHREAETKKKQKKKGVCLL